MDKDRVEGSAKQVKGAVKSAVGKAVGDAKLQNSGEADKAAGKIQNAVITVSDRPRASPMYLSVHKHVWAESVDNPRGARSARKKRGLASLPIPNAWLFYEAKSMVFATPAAFSCRWCWPSW